MDLALSMVEDHSPNVPLVQPYHTCKTTKKLLMCCHEEIEHPAYLT